MSIEKDFKCLDDFNDTLDNIINFVEKSFSTLEDLEGKAQEFVQEEVDKICEKVSKKGTEKANVVRAKVVNILHKKYSAALYTMSILKPIADANPIDLPSVIDTLKNTINVILGPYKYAVEFINALYKVAIPKIMESANKVAYLYSLKDNIPIPDGLDINFDKLNLYLEPISLQEIMSGTDGPKPEPEPEPEPGPPIGKLQATFNSYEEWENYVTNPENAQYYEEGAKTIVWLKYTSSIDKNDYDVMIPLSVINGLWIVNKRCYPTQKELLEAYIYWDKGRIFLLSFKELACYLGVKKNDKGKLEVLYEKIEYRNSDMKPLYFNIYKNGVDWKNAVD